MNSATDFEGSGSPRSTSRSSNRGRGGGGDNGSQDGDTVQRVAQQAKKGAKALASEANDRLQGVFDRQVDAGADLIDNVAEAVRAAADNLDEGAPRLAEFVRDAADRVESFSETVRDQSAGDVLAAGADFARRRPAIVFGAAAVVGYLMVRLLKPSSGDGSRYEENFEELDEGPEWASQSRFADSPAGGGTGSPGFAGGSGGDRSNV